MSETLTISSRNIKSWLENETSSIFVPVHSRAEKVLAELRRTLNELSNASKMLFDNSAKEIEKRNLKTYKRARALNKLSRLFLERTRQIKIPENVSYDSLNNLIGEIQKALAVTEIDVRNWFPRISPFFILDRRKFLVEFEKSKATLKEAQNFLSKEYAKTKTLEETFQLIDKLQILEGELSKFKEQKTEVENEKEMILKEIADVQQKMADLKSKGEISQLSQVNLEIEALNAEVKHSLQHLQKPFIKMKAQSLHGGGSGLTQDELKKLTRYLENPFEALATEENGYPILRQILQKLALSMTSGKLKLKPEKMRKAGQTIENILKRNSLDEPYKKCVDIFARKNSISASAELAKSQSGLSKLQEDLENLDRRKNVIESKEKAVERAIKETLEKIQNHKDRIEKNIQSFLGKKVIIEKIEA
ncbi:MAG: hypothetical protein ACP5IM_03375 [Candidatus Bathyarchaeia archaeon]